MRFFLSGSSIGLLRGVPGEPPAPAGATVLTDSAGATDFDGETNAQLVADFSAGYSRFSAVGGIIRRDGVNVTYAADAQTTIQGRGQFVGGVRVPQDRSTTSASFVDVPDLRFQLEPNSHYAFQFDGAYTTAAGTTGIQLAVNGPASPDFLGLGFELMVSTSAWLSAFTGAYDTGVNGTGSGGATPLPFHVFGTISTGAAGGLLVLRGRSEVGGNAVTIKRGSYGLLFKVG